LPPAYLIDARERLERGKLSPGQLKRLEDRAVDEAVALLEAAGLGVVTDGELRRFAFFGHLICCSSMFYASEGTTGLRSRCSGDRDSSGFSSNMTMSAPARSSPCDGCRTIGSSYSGS
jgi:hypothetical protein